MKEESYQTTALRAAAGGCPGDLPDQVPPGWPRRGMSVMERAALYQKQDRARRKAMTWIPAAREAAMAEGEDSPRLRQMVWEEYRRIVWASWD